ncbi:MAG: efflux transporter periplasmic adaptor subunit, partial [Bacteroidota bacterium]
VFVLNEDGTVQYRKVKTGIQDNLFIQILEGLKEGEQVVTAPYSVVSRTLNNGDKVEKVSKEELFNKKQ